LIKYEAGPNTSGEAGARLDGLSPCGWGEYDPSQAVNKHQGVPKRRRKADARQLFLWDWEPPKKRPSAQEQEAAKKKIARKYERPKPKHDRERLIRIRHGLLMKLYGRRGLTELQARAAIDDAVPNLLASPREIGLAVQLKFEERRSWKMSQFIAYDVSEAEQKAYYRQKKRERDAAAAAAKRARHRLERAERGLRVAKHHDLDVRAEVLFGAIASAWVTVRGLLALIARADAFKRPDGKRLHGASLATAVHKGLNELTVASKIESENRPNLRGWKVRHVRRFD
jgi:hypothetical protein